MIFCSSSQFHSNDLFERIKQKYQQNSRIERIMNPEKSFPIEQSYINLAIGKAKDQDEKEKRLRNTHDGDAVIDTFEVIYGVKTAVNVTCIFESCTKEKKQVLVFGRAGIGKSTFCRYIAYQWAKGTYWTQYKLVALIPLRRLTENRYSRGVKYSLIDLVKREVLSNELSKDEEAIFEKQFDIQKTLWILDGYDEIVQNLPPHLECLLDQLLKTPFHILTSRPYLITLPYDVQMEITGFTDENIEEYVQQFFNQMQDELCDTSINSERLLVFLKANRSIWGVAHIPVNLELICNVWSNNDISMTSDLSITELYTTMVEWLCRRYLKANNIFTQTMPRTEVFQHCHKELTFLEYLAFNGMQNGNIIIRPKLLQNALAEARIVSLYDKHVLNIGILKSFTKQGTGTQIQTDKDHYFVDLSFQEYFAASYLTNGLKKSPNDNIIDFIKNKKYHQRYELMFSFASALINDSESTEYSSLFWQAIMGDPLDLVGIRHIQLVTSCLEATTDKSIVPQYTELLKWIAGCIKYNLHAENEIICKYMSHSLQKAQSVVCDEIIINVFIELLRHEDKNKQISVLSFISKLEISNPLITLINSIGNLVKSGNEKVRAYACESLGRMGDKAATDEIISLLVNAIKDGNKFVRSNACFALGKMNEKAAIDEVISKLFCALEDSDENVRSNAYQALGKIGVRKRTNEFIRLLINSVESQNQYVREGACKVFGIIGEKVATSEIINKLMNATEDKIADVRANACEALGRMNSIGATDEVISKLLSALGDKSPFVRKKTRLALAKLCKKVTTDATIQKLVNALDDECANIRSNVCGILGNLGEKVATDEVIDKLMNLANDEDQNVRSSVFEALGKIGEKAITDKVISILVTALEDENDYVKIKIAEAFSNMRDKAVNSEILIKIPTIAQIEHRYDKEVTHELLRTIDEETTSNENITEILKELSNKDEYLKISACNTLESLGEKAATDEVINKLVCLINTGNYRMSKRATETIGRLLSSSELVKRLNNNVLSDLCLCKRAVDCFKNISADCLIDIYLNTGRSYWLRAITEIALVRRIAIILVESNVVIYDKRESLLPTVQDMQLHRDLKKALISQRQRLHIDFNAAYHQNNMSRSKQNFRKFRKCFCSSASSDSF